MLAISCKPSPKAERESEPAKELAGFPYLASTPVDDASAAKSGVTRIDRAAVSPGITGYCTRLENRVTLLDTDGKVVHTIPAPDCVLLEPMFPSGFMAIKAGGIMRLDWSGVVWEKPGAYHHDIAVAPEQDRIWTLFGGPPRQLEGFPPPMVDTYILELTPEGERRKATALHPMLAPHILPGMLAALARDYAAGNTDNAFFTHGVADVYHVNALERLPRDTPIGKAGQFLGCARNINLLFVVDLETQRLVWSWGQGVLDMPHHPTLLDNGNVLVFDNGTRRGWSRVLELDTRTMQPVWEFSSRDPLFFSKFRGAAQRLANGNTLITESEAGRLIEVTRDGRVVWEYWNPTFSKEGGGDERVLIQRATRWSPEELNPEWFRSRR